MKLTLLAALWMPQFKWSQSAALAETILTTPDLDQPTGILKVDTELISPDTERSLQPITCGIQSQWEEIVVLDVKYNPNECFQGINSIDFRLKPPADTKTSLFLNDMRNAYKYAYDDLQGSETQKGGSTMYCDPYARKVKEASVQRVTKRSDSRTLAVEMRITSTCRGCDTSNRKIFDLPIAPGAPRANLPLNNCAYPTGISKKRIRAPYESDFAIQFQQYALFFDNVCVQEAYTCSYGTPFLVDMEIDIDVDDSAPP